MEWLLIIGAFIFGSLIPEFTVAVGGGKVRFSYFVNFLAGFSSALCASWVAFGLLQ